MGLSIGAGQTEEKIVGFYHINKMNKMKRKSTFLRFVSLNTETAKKISTLLSPSPPQNYNFSLAVPTNLSKQPDDPSSFLYIIIDN